MAQLSGLLRHEIMDFMFSNPTMLDDLDYLYKSDTARKLMFYYQDERPKEDYEKMRSKSKRRGEKAKEVPATLKKVLTVEDGTETPLTGVAIFLLRTSTKRTLGEETFQREIMCGLLNAQEGDYLLWNIERTITKIYIPVLLGNLNFFWGSSSWVFTNWVWHKVGRSHLALKNAWVYSKLGRSKCFSNYLNFHDKSY